MAPGKHYTPYFLQTKEWSDFWLDAMNNKHLAYLLEAPDSKATFAGWVYKYPWHLNQSFLYVPKGPIVTLHKKNIAKSELLKLFRTFCYRLVASGQTHDTSFIKLDFDDEVMKLFGVENTEDLEELMDGVLANDGKHNFPKCELHTGTKTIQYMQTMILDGRVLKGSRVLDWSMETLQNYYTENKDFWSQTNQNIRRYSKKSLKYDWEIIVDKSPETFDGFWKVYKATSERQKFATHNKEYFEKLAARPFTHIALLKYQGEVVSCWFGVQSGDTLTYLYGGNTAEGFKLKSQYMMHIVALKILVDNKLSYYDLGGYDSSKGFGKFKEGYRGDIRSFLGPVDIVLQPRKYAFTNRFVKTTKNITGLFNR